MGPREIAAEFAYPVRNLTVLLSALFIFALLKIATYGGVLGLVLVFLVLPSLLHFLMRILDRRARGMQPGPLEIDDMQWYHAPWRLFAIVHVVVFGYGSFAAAAAWGPAGAAVVMVLLAAVIPASLAILAVTRSPLQSLRPQAVAGVIGRVGTTYWLLPTFVLAAIVLLRWLATKPWSDRFVDLCAYYLLFVFFSLTGAVVRPFDLHAEIDIHEPAEPAAALLDERLVSQRRRVLNHAYGFISRGNRAGGFRHIEDWLHEDPNPEAGWAWFFDQMMCWERRDAALVFGQSYLGQLLRAGDKVNAVKVMLRCRLENPGFMPLDADLELARDAARECRNDDLLRVLG